MPPKDRDQDRRIRVSDRERFLAEMDRMGLDIEPAQYRVVGAEEASGEPDPNLDDEAQAAMEAEEDR
jgi:hypothetical protein